MGRIGICQCKLIVNIKKQVKYVCIKLVRACWENWPNPILRDIKSCTFPIYAALRPWKIHAAFNHQPNSLKERYVADWPPLVCQQYAFDHCIDSLSISTIEYWLVNLYAVSEFNLQLHCTCSVLRYELPNWWSSNEFPWKKKEKKKSENQQLFFSSNAVHNSLMT